jgi:hypothetical protein
MAEIILKSREQTADLLKTRPDPDETIQWTCPECGAKNTETHFCRATRCGCEKFIYPRIPLPIKGDAKTSLQAAVAGDRLQQIEKDIAEYMSEIDNFQGEIDEREEWIYELKKERKSLRIAAGLDK